MDEKRSEGARELDLIREALGGSIEAATSLVREHEAFIYNIAYRMTANAQDAEDATQEILMKMLTSLSTFDGRSRFTTWLYRMAVNHVLNMKRSRNEEFFVSFERHREFIGEAALMGERSPAAQGPEDDLLLEGMKHQCMMGMLLCLEREQRLAFILGFVFDMPAKAAGEIMDTSAANFRQLLHRARGRLRNYMDANCGLLDGRNSCRCLRTARGAIDGGVVDPVSLRFNPGQVARIEDFVSEKAKVLETRSARKMRELFLSSPFVESDAVARKISQLRRKEPENPAPERMDGALKGRAPPRGRASPETAN